jgi:AbrB family looped-hinge helix DNA binding protein
MNARARLSSKGQLVVPKTVRDAHGWGPGTEIEFVESGKGVLLRPVDDLEARFPSITMDELFARSVKVDRFPTEAEIEETVRKEAARRFDAATRR